MLLSRRLQVATGLLLVMLCALLVYQAQPQLYIYNPLQLVDGVPEMQSMPILACPPAPPQPVDLRPGPDQQEELPTVYVITPTYPRAVQVPEMTRLAQTLMLTKNVFWVVTEDAERPTAAVDDILQRSGIPHVHILGLKPEKYRKGYKGTVPRGVSNRMAALQWLRSNVQSGVFYFADDDNTYDYRLFAELAKTQRASAFPVGLVTKAGISTPVVRDGVVIEIYDGWIGGRTFPMDMAGFAVNVQLLHEHPDAKMPFTAGYEEDGFLKSLKLTTGELEPLADNCTKILVWHTQTKQPAVPFNTVDPNKYRGTNMDVLRYIVNPSARAPGSIPLRRLRPTHPRRRSRILDSSSSVFGYGPVSNAATDLQSSTYLSSLSQLHLSKPANFSNTLHSSSPLNYFTKLHLFNSLNFTRHVHSADQSNSSSHPHFFNRKKSSSLMNSSSSLTSSDAASRITSASSMNVSNSMGSFTSPAYSFNRSYTDEVGRWKVDTTRARSNAVVGAVVGQHSSALETSTSERKTFSDSIVSTGSSNMKSAAALSQGTNSTSVSRINARVSAPSSASVAAITSKSSYSGSFMSHPVLATTSMDSPTLSLSRSFVSPANSAASDAVFPSRLAASGTILPSVSVTNGSIPPYDMVGKGIMSPPISTTNNKALSSVPITRAVGSQPSSVASGMVMPHVITTTNIKSPPGSTVNAEVPLSSSASAANDTAIFNSHERDSVSF